MDSKKMKALYQIQKAKEFYVIMSKCTRLPYVHCNEETFDDEVFLFLNEDAAKDVVTDLAKRDELVDLVAIQQKGGLGFFNSLFSIGVNSIYIDKGTKEEVVMQLAELVKRPDMPNRIENPEFHLTAIYYMQKLRAGKAVQGTEEIKELQEEMMIHFWEGKIILVLHQDTNKVPLMKDKNGKIYQPIFTDLNEFQRFGMIHKNATFKTMVLDANKMPMAIAKEADGVTVNPFGINLQLDIKRKEASE